MNAPHAPWRLLGESLVCFGARCPGTRLPDGVHRVAGPCVVVASRYDDSPVGPYVELGVGEPARLGARPGICWTTMVVSSADARVGGILNWGFPKELGTLRWSADGDVRELCWEERGVIVRGSVRRHRLPVVVSVRNVQRRADGPVVVRTRTWGKASVASVEVAVPDDDDGLGPLRGSHRGLHISGMRFVVDPARSPVGLTSTLRAPLRAPEPALSWGSSGD